MGITYLNHFFWLIANWKWANGSNNYFDGNCFPVWFSSVRIIALYHLYHAAVARLNISIINGQSTKTKNSQSRLANNIGEINSSFINSYSKQTTKKKKRRPLRSLIILPKENLTTNDRIKSHGQNGPSWTIQQPFRFFSFFSVWHS